MRTMYIILGVVGWAWTAIVFVSLAVAALRERQRRREPSK